MFFTKPLIQASSQTCINTGFANFRAVIGLHPTGPGLITTRGSKEKLILLPTSWAHKGGPPAGKPSFTYLNHFFFFCFSFFSCSFSFLSSSFYFYFFSFVLCVSLVMCLCCFCSCVLFISLFCLILWRMQKSAPANRSRALETLFDYTPYQNRGLVMG